MCIHHAPGANPANRPGQSTHERRNDGIAYPGPVGEQLEYWQVGMDWDNPPAAMAAAHKLGWIATTTYPLSAHETQHVNFRKEPETGLPSAKPGDEGAERPEDHARARDRPQPVGRAPVSARGDSRTTGRR